MSLFGAVDDADRRRWQRGNLTVVAELVGLGEARKLAPLFWRLPVIGVVSGTYCDTDQHPREVFEAWCGALAADRRVEPSGLGWRGELPARSERVDDTGRICLMHGFTFRDGRLSSGRAGFVVQAEWWEDTVTDRLAGGRR